MTNPSRFLSFGRFTICVHGVDLPRSWRPFHSLFFYFSSFWRHSLGRIPCRYFAMALSPARSWSLFRAVRVLIYSLAIFASMGIAAIYAVLLIRGWNSYSLDQRIIAVVLFVIYAFSSVMLYSMFIFRFRLWMDGARLVVLILAQIGGTVAFDIFENSFPCSNLGSLSTCKTVETVAIFGGWSTAGLLLIFSLYLVSMHYVPIPSRRPDPEALLALQLVSEKRREMYEKRGSMKSLASASSVYSQQSHITPYPYMAPSTTNSRSSPVMSDVRRMQANGQYRPQSPAYTRAIEPPTVQYRPQIPGYMQAADFRKGVDRIQAPSESVANQYRTQSPAYPPPTTTRLSPITDLQRLSPLSDDNRPRAVASPLSEETGATAGSSLHIRPPAAYDYRSKSPGPMDFGINAQRSQPAYEYPSQTPGPIGGLVDGLNKPAPTYGFNHSRAPGSAESMGTNSSHGSHNSRMPPSSYQGAVRPALSVRSVSSIRTAPRQQYYQSNGIPAPKPLLAPERNYLPLTEAFTEPIISRQGTPMTSFTTASFNIQDRQPLTGHHGLIEGYNFPPIQEVAYESTAFVAPLKISEKNRAKPPPHPITPVAVQFQDPLMQANGKAYSNPTPRTRSDTTSSVPRSPSLENVSVHNMPTTPQSAALPARPDLSPALYIGRYRSPAPTEDQRQRFGSVPDINVTADSPILGNEDYSDFRRQPPARNWVTNPPTSSENVTSISHWREKLARTVRS